MKNEKLTLDDLQELEREIAREKHSLSPDFSVRVMEKIEERSSIIYKLKEVVAMSSTVLSGKRLVAAAGIFTVIFCFAYGVREFDKVDTISEQVLSQHGSSTARLKDGASNEEVREVLPLEEEQKSEESADLITPSMPITTELKDAKNKSARGNARNNELELLKPTLSGYDNEPPTSAISAQPLPLMQNNLRVKNSNFQGLDASRSISVAPITPPYYPPTQTNRENYGEYEENPRILVSTEPRSTFSIDVDTASYTNARRYIRMGQLPPSNSIRIEEFINYFDYNYPSQSKEPFGVHYEIAPSPFSEGRHLLKIGIKAKDVERDDNKPWNLVFLIDVSGSMASDDKLPLLKRSLKLLVNKMRATDTLGIVTYAGGVGVALEPTSGNEKAKITSVIDSLNPYGSTHGSGGIIAAYDLLVKNYNDKATNRVILASDGDFNVGITSFKDLIKLIEEKRKTGIFLTTLGFGQGNLNDQNMEQLANKGNGSYYYLDSFREARKVLETGLTSNLDVVAKDVKLQIEFNPANVIEYRLIGYDNRKLRNQDFTNDKIDAGEIGAGHTVTALYEIVLANSELAKSIKGELRYEGNKAKVENASTDAKELAFLKIRYKEANSDSSKPLSYPINMRDLKDSFDSSSPDFRFAVAVSGLGEFLRNGDFASQIDLENLIKIAEKSKGTDSHGYRQELIELVKNLAAIKNSND